MICSRGPPPPSGQTAGGNTAPTAIRITTTATRSVASSSFRTAGEQPPPLAAQLAKARVLGRYQHGSSWKTKLLLPGLQATSTAAAVKLLSRPQKLNVTTLMQPASQALSAVLLHIGK